MVEGVKMRKATSHEIWKLKEPQGVIADELSYLWHRNEYFSEEGLKGVGYAPFLLSATALGLLALREE